eukprot:3359501-Rhodomonas_salina.1
MCWWGMTLGTPSLSPMPVGRYGLPGPGPYFGTLVGKPWHPLGVYSSTTTTVPAPGMHTQWVPRFESTKVTVWDNNNANNTTELNIHEPLILANYPSSLVQMKTLGTTGAGRLKVKSCLVFEKLDAAGRQRSDSYWYRKAGPEKNSNIGIPTWVGSPIHRDGWIGRYSLLATTSSTTAATSTTTTTTTPTTPTFLAV